MPPQSPAPNLLPSEQPPTEQSVSTPQPPVNDLPSEMSSDTPQIGASQSRWRDAFSAAFIVVVAFVVALILTFFIFQQYQVDGPSMMPTLQTGNRLIVLKLPQTWAKLTGHPYIPSRGDIVVFIESSVASLNQTGSDQLIKRVVGLPGDRVVVKDGTLTIYNAQHPDGFQPDKTLAYGKNLNLTTGDNVDITVPPDQIFVCGDNRDNSLDSRVFGTVPVKDIVGRLVLRITPVNEIKDF